MLLPSAASPSRSAQGQSGPACRARSAMPAVSGSATRLLNGAGSPQPPRGGHRAEPTSPPQAAKAASPEGSLGKMGQTLENCITVRGGIKKRTASYLLAVQMYFAVFWGENLSPASKSRKSAGRSASWKEAEPAN